MQRHRRVWVLAAGLGLFAVLLAGALSAYGLRANAAAVPSPQDGRPDQVVVETYFGILNSGMSDPTYFSQLATVYAPDATLILSNTGGGHKAIQGIDKITSWYKAFQLTHAGLQFVEDSALNRTPLMPLPSLRNLAPHVVVSYEVAGPGKCEHLFTLQGGMIQTLDWTTYYLAA